MTKHAVDFLCFGAHPDDIEIGMAGTIRKHVDLGYKVALCDLTMAELSSNGTVTERQQEAENAAKILGAQTRINLGFPDRGLTPSQDVISALVSVIRDLRPSYVFVPYEQDRHPDHGMVSKLVEEAVFNAGIRKYQLANEEEVAYKVPQLFYYFINGLATPDLLIDTSPYMDVKKQALMAYTSQFMASKGEVKTRLNEGFIEVIEGRDRLYGKMKNVTFAEGFMSKEPFIMQHLPIKEKKE